MNPVKLVKKTLITGLNSFFYPDLRKRDFRGIFALTCLILFLSGNDNVKIRFYFSFLVTEKFTSKRNPEKEENLARENKNTP